MLLLGPYRINPKWFHFCCNFCPQKSYFDWTFDLSAAFDTIDHTVLLDHLSSSFGNWRCSSIVHTYGYHGTEMAFCVLMSRLLTHLWLPLYFICGLSDVIMNEYLFIILWHLSCYIDYMSLECFVWIKPFWHKTKTCFALTNIYHLESITIW